MNCCKLSGTPLSFNILLSVQFHIFLLQDSSKSRAGPFTFKELKEEWVKQAQLSLKTLCWAQGMGGWYPLSSITQLKWTLASSVSFICTI